MSERGDRDLPEIGERGGESDGGDGEEIGLVVADVHPRTDRPRRRATRGLRRDNFRLLGDVTPVLPSSTGEERATPQSTPSENGGARSRRASGSRFS